MSALTEYTLEVYKTDRRTKVGERLVETKDFDPMTAVEIEEIAEFLRAGGYRVVVKETYVTRTSAMNGAEFRERYDTPYYCSPSSETYWSM